MSKMCYLSLPTGIEITLLWNQTTILSYFPLPCWNKQAAGKNVTFPLWVAALPTEVNWWTTTHCSPDFCNSLLSSLSENTASQKAWASDSTGAKEAILFNQLITKHRYLCWTLSNKNSLKGFCTNKHSPSRDQHKKEAQCPLQICFQLICTQVTSASTV